MSISQIQLYGVVVSDILQEQQKIDNVTPELYKALEFYEIDVKMSQKAVDEQSEKNAGLTVEEIGKNSYVTKQGVIALQESQKGLAKVQAAIEQLDTEHGELQDKIEGVAKSYLSTEKVKISDVRDVLTLDELVEAYRGLQALLESNTLTDNGSLSPEREEVRFALEYNLDTIKIALDQTVADLRAIYETSNGFKNWNT